ncbi:hypothetical protein PMAYCL1PPCAC_20235, partial [Pristionchus mayeri]
HWLGPHIIRQQDPPLTQQAMNKSIMIYISGIGTCFLAMASTSSSAACYFIIGSRPLVVDSKLILSIVAIFHVVLTNLLDEMRSF